MLIRITCWDGAHGRTGQIIVIRKEDLISFWNRIFSFIAFLRENCFDWRLPSLHGITWRQPSSGMWNAFSVFCCLVNFQTVMITLSVLSGLLVLGLLVCCLCCCCRRRRRQRIRWVMWPLGGTQWLVIRRGWYGPVRLQRPRCAQRTVPHTIKPWALKRVFRVYKRRFKGHFHFLKIHVVANFVSKSPIARPHIAKQ